VGFLQLSGIFLKNFVLSFISFSVLGMLLTGCGTNNTKRLPQDSESISTTESSTSPTKTTEELFQTTLTLPNGDIVMPNQTVKWKDLSIQLLVTSLPTQSSSPDKYKEIIGSHSTTINYEKVSTLDGKADLVLNKRTSPAASQSTAATYEYWAIVYGKEYVYAIDATIVGNKDKAKSGVLELLKNWKIPK
jgi:hypothetical protein